MTNPHAKTAAATFLIDRMRDLKHRKSQKEIAQEAGFLNANMLSLLKSGANKILLDRVPALTKALEADPAYLMRLSLEQSVGITAANAICDCFGTPVTIHEQGWLQELRDASGNTVPRLTARSRSALRGIFAK